jgi:NDP-sugar pyrophosphorylase family protein
MAAGLGRRFGGAKQLAAVGPRDEALLDYSIADALAAGFGEVVVVVRAGIEDEVRDHLGRHHPGVGFRYARQDGLGPPRPKPWGTLPAVLSAAPWIRAPFAVVNADDHYGAASLRIAAGELAASRPGRAANVAFPLGSTVPARGAVTRAVCQVHDGRLVRIVETEGCERRPDGTLVAGGEVVPEATLASMNLWCFDPSVLADFDERWRGFLDRWGDDPGAECQLPTVVGELVDQDRLEVAVRPTPDTWIGITNPEDLEPTRAALARR